MTALSAHGLAVGLPAGMEARIVLRRPGADGDRPHPVLHVASFTLPERRDDFGGGVTQLMRPSDMFLVVFEYGPEAVGTALFAHQGVPRLAVEQFGSQRLQRPLPGQLGCQLFFTEKYRPFCVYAVAGSRAHLAPIVAQANAVLDRLEIAP